MNLECEKHKGICAEKRGTGKVHEAPTSATGAAQARSPESMLLVESRTVNV